MASDTRDVLRALGDQLSDEDARAVLAFARWLLRARACAAGPAPGTTMAAAEARYAALLPADDTLAPLEAAIRAWRDEGRDA